MQKKTFLSLCIGGGTLIILMAVYAYIRLNSNMREDDFQERQKQNIFYTGTTTPNTPSPLPSKENELTDLTSSDAFFVNTLKLQDGTQIFFDQVEKNSNSSENYGIFVQKPNQPKKLVVGKISNIIYNEGGHTLLETPNPNIVLAEVLFTDVVQSKMYYFIDTQKETFLSLDLHLRMSDDLTYLVGNNQKDFSVGLKNSKNCWTEKEEKCDIGAKKSYSSITVNEKDVLNTPNFVAICGENRGIEGYCNEEPRIDFTFTGVDTLLQKAFFTIKQDHVAKANYVFNLTDGTLNPTSVAPDLDFRYYDKDLGVSFEYDPQQWETPPQSKDNIIVLQGLASHNSSMGDYITDGIRIESVQKTLGQYIEQLKNESKKIVDTHPLILDGKNTTQIQYISTDEVKVENTAIFVPRTKDSIVITFDDTREAHHHFISTIKIFDTKTSQLDLCNEPPTPTDMGSDIYPIDPKYKNLGFLGQIFTAETCGNERMQKIDGVEGPNYILGSNITLKPAPSNQLLNTLQSLGFVCASKSNDIKACTEWKTNKTVLIKDLLRLEPFYKEFISDDCVNCG